MWDSAWPDMAMGSTHLSHDMPCPRCRHAPHVYLACGDGCECPTMRPGVPGADRGKRSAAALPISGPPVRDSTSCDATLVSGRRAAVSCWLV